MSYTPYNAPLLGPLLGDSELLPHFSVRADIDGMVRFEKALATAEAACDLIPVDAARAISLACECFQPDIKILGAGLARDGVVVPQFVRLLRAHIGEPHAEHVHFGATSQDLIDTSLALRMKEVTRILETRIEDLDDILGSLDSKFGDQTLMGRTRMQAALPMRVRDRLRTWQQPLKSHQVRLREILPDLLQLQFGGAVGTLDRFGASAQEVSRRLAKELDLTEPRAPWHTDRTARVELAHWLARVTGTLGKLGQDIALMAQNGIDDISISGAGGSSAMPHKQNPIKAETLVTLARFNAVLVSGMHHSMVHEQERSGAAWTLEWMLLPQMVVATGAATRLASELLGKIARIGSVGS
ncbi:MAG: 3-carboxy-cis,cis-muconate cycloisomerase [Hyphomicrobiaceae bacterium]